VIERERVVAEAPELARDGGDGQRGVERPQEGEAEVARGLVAHVVEHGEDIGQRVVGVLAQQDERRARVEQPQQRQPAQARL